jgi:hypothetical protein
MSALAIRNVEELSPSEAAGIRGGNPVLAASVAVAGMMVTAFGAGFRFGYDVLGPWLLENVF